MIKHKKKQQKYTLYTNKTQTQTSIKKESTDIQISIQQMLNCSSSFDMTFNGIYICKLSAILTTINRFLSVWIICFDHSTMDTFDSENTQKCWSIESHNTVERPQLPLPKSFKYFDIDHTFSNLFNSFGKRIVILMLPSPQICIFVTQYSLKWKKCLNIEYTDTHKKPNDEQII